MMIALVILARMRHSCRKEKELRECATRVEGVVTEVRLESKLRLR